MRKLAIDIGANRGDWTYAALAKGYDVIALEPGKIFNQLVKNFIYEPRVTPLKLAASMQDYVNVEFYECVEDGLSSLNKDWLTADGMPYKGKEYKTINVTTITLDTLAAKYGKPDLVKLDVEGSEWHVFKGMSSYMGKVAFEWTDATIDQHQLQHEYLMHGDYKLVAPQFIVKHCEEPDEWFDIRTFNLAQWVADNSAGWVNGGWEVAGLRPTADVGMIWCK